MIDWLRARARATPRAEAIFIGSDSWNYQQLDSLVTAVAGRLQNVVAPGDRVAILLPNNLLFVCLVHAVPRLGAVLVPLNRRLAPAELDYQLQRSRCEVLIYGKQTAAQARALAVEDLILIAEEALLGQAVETAPSLPPRHFSSDTIHTIVHTSGTTGQAKGAMLTFGNHLASANASAFRLGVLPHDRWLSVLPLYHVGGLAILLRSCLYGTAVVLHDLFDEEAISRSLETQDITLVSLVPTMVQRLLDARSDQPWPASLRHVLVGGAAAPSELVQRCLHLGIPISTTYGLTEAASQVTTLTTEGLAAKYGAVGPPLLFTDVTIRDQEGQALPAGKEGEIAVSGPTIMAGYDRDLQATARAIRDGLLYTGDIGYLDDEGDLWLLQRRSDMILSGGENIYPAEVEAVLRRHPDVTAVCVVGLPDPHWGQRVAAALTLHHPVPTEALEQHCRRYLAGYKVPRQFTALDRLPLTASGKIARQAVVEQLLAAGNE